MAFLNSAGQEGVYTSTQVTLSGAAIEGNQTVGDANGVDGTHYMFKFIDKFNPTNWEVRTAQFNDLAVDTLTSFGALLESQGAIADGTTVLIFQIITSDDLESAESTERVEYTIKCVEAGGVSKGQALAYSGWNDGLNAIEVVLADNASNVAIGLATTDLANNESGHMIAAGVLENVNTSSYSAGTILFVNGFGDLTAVNPTSGFEQPIAFVLRSHATNGDLQVLSSYPKQDAEDVRIDDTANYFPSPNVESALQYLGEYAASANVNGFVDRTEVTLSWDDVTRTATLTPVGADFTIYSDSAKFTFSTPQSKQITDVEGGHYIYFDENGDLQVTTSFLPSLISTYAFVVYIYWDAANNKAVPDAIIELHGTSMDPITHSYLHNSVGTVYQSGLDLTADSSGNGDDADDAQFSAAAGIIWDEDIKHDVALKALLSNHILVYRDGINGDWRSDTTNYLAKLGVSRAAYNEWTGATWQLTDVTNNDYVLAHVFAIPGVSESWMVIMGQNEYSTLSLAQTGATTELTALQVGSLPVTEFAPVATFILQTGTGYANAVKARIVQTVEGGDYIDWRTNNAVAAVGGSATDHNSLTGLQGGVVGEYYHLPQDVHDYVLNTILVDTTINVAASGGDFTTVGAAYDSLDSKFIAPGVIVTISAAAGTYSESPIALDHPQGIQIHIAGASSATTILDFGSGAGVAISDAKQHGDLTACTIKSSSVVDVGLSVAKRGHLNSSGDLRIEGFNVGIDVNKEATVIIPSPVIHNVNAVGLRVTSAYVIANSITISGLSALSTQHVVATQGARVSITSATLSQDSNHTGIYADTGAVIIATNSVISGDVTYFGVYSLYGGSIYFYNGTISGAVGTYGMTAQYSGQIHATYADITGASSWGIMVSYSGYVSFNNGTISGACSIGIYVFKGSRVNMNSASITGASAYGVIAQYGSMIDAEAVSVDGATTGIGSYGSSYIWANGSAVTNYTTDYSPAINTQGNEYSYIDT